MGFVSKGVGTVILIIGVVIIIASLIIPNFPGAMDWYKSLTIGEQSAITLPFQLVLTNVGWAIEFSVKPLIWGFSILLIIGIVLAIIGLYNLIK